MIQPEILLDLMASDRLAAFVPNRPQWDYCSAHDREVLLSGPNQYAGKTHCTRYLLAVHATGRYPAEWTGPRFGRPPRILMLTTTDQVMRDQILHHVFAEHFEMQDIHGAGWIRPHEYEEPERGRDGAIVAWRVRHLHDGAANGYSLIRFATYAGDGKARIAGGTHDLVVLNEIPPEDYYTEARNRVNVTGGYVRVAGCPIGEQADLYDLFKGSSPSEGLRLIAFGIDECTHLPLELREEAKRIQGSHIDAEARLWGRPCRSSGRVFSGDPACAPREPYEHEHLLIGLDWPHGVGTYVAALLAHDREQDIVTVLRSYIAAGQDRATYARGTIALGGDRIPCAWPKDNVATTSRASAPRKLRDVYAGHGMLLLPEPAHYLDGRRRSHAVMPIVEDIQDRMASGRFFVSRQCQELLRQFRQLRHKSGKLVAYQTDDGFDAVVKGMMMLRYARPGRADPIPARKRSDANGSLEGLDYWRGEAREGGVMEVFA